MSSIKPLTDKQQKVLDYINFYQLENGQAPTLREIAEFLGTSNISTAQYFVDQIKMRGHISKTSNNSRGINTQPLSVVPLLGKIAAGRPIEAIEDSEPVTVPTHIKLNAMFSYYALQVSGDSMMDMGVLDGDIVLVQHQFTAKDGDVVVGIINGEATLKVFKRKGDKVILEARNPAYQPMVLDHIDIRGKFVGLIRPT